jgi:hypothetical protein
MAVSSLVMEDQCWADEGDLRLACESATKLQITVAPCACLLEGLAPRLAMADDARSTKIETSWMDSIDLNQAHLLVGVPLADLGPGQWIRDRCDLLGSAHPPHPRFVAASVKFLASAPRGTIVVSPAKSSQRLRSECRTSAHRTSTRPSAARALRALRAWPSRVSLQDPPDRLRQRHQDDVQV